MRVNIKLFIFTFLFFSFLYSLAPSFEWEFINGERTRDERGESVLEYKGNYFILKQTDEGSYHYISLIKLGNGGNLIYEKLLSGLGNSSIGHHIIKSNTYGIVITGGDGEFWESMGFIYCEYRFKWQFNLVSKLWWFCY